MTATVIDYVSDRTLHAEQNARGRLAHYQSELARLEAIKLSQTIHIFKKESKND